MEASQLQRLIDTLSVPTVFGDERLMIAYITNFLIRNQIPFSVDKYGNIYATKGTSDVYPCVVAHTDTVHAIEEFIVHQETGDLFARTPDGKQSGIGGDNKAGVFVCLELLMTREVLKAAFFVSEEVGCLGSYLSDPTFFTNVGYALQFDAPHNDWVTRFSNGVRLFNHKGEFFKKILPLLREHMNYGNTQDSGIHPYTDVSALKILYNFSCINYSVGYYKMHSVREYVTIKDVLLAYDMTHSILDTLGNDLYEFAPQRSPQLKFNEPLEYEKHLNYYRQKRGWIV